LIKLDAETLEMQTYTAKDGLPSNSITSIISDGHGNLWIGTDYGLSRMNLKDGTFANFFSEDGLQENEFSRGAVASQGGKLYFGGVGGISYFDVKSM
jgi:ligand-binding sensor domain-containing protein